MKQLMFLVGAASLLLLQSTLSADDTSSSNSSRKVYRLSQRTNKPAKANKAPTSYYEDTAFYEANSTIEQTPYQTDYYQRYIADLANPSQSTTTTTSTTTTAPSTPSSNAISDSVLKRRIELDIREDTGLTTNGKSVQIQVLDGVVTVSGAVSSEYEKSQVETIIRRNKGVKKIENAIKVIPIR